MKKISTIVPIKQIKVNGRIRQPDVEKVKEIANSINEIGLINPLTISSDYYLLAGGHRLAALKLLKQKNALSRIMPFSHNSVESKLFEVDENLIRKELSVLEQSEYLLLRIKLIAEINKKTKSKSISINSNEKENITKLKNIENTMGLSAKSVIRLLGIAKNLTQNQRNLIRGTYLANEQKELLEISRIKDTKRRTGVIRLLINQSPPKTVNEAVRKYRINNGEISAQLDIIKPSNWWSFGQPKWRQEGFKGGIPGEIYANALYYFAPENGIVADAMAGSGMLKRVYNDRALWQRDRKLNLNIKLYDLYPRKPFSSKYEILKHDMEYQLPQKVDWLFIDPPYFRIASNLYDGELAKTNSYKKYLYLMSKVISAAQKSLKKNGVLCLFSTAYINVNETNSNPIDVPKDLLEIACKKRLTPFYRIYVSRGEQQRPSSGMLNIKSKSKRKPFSDVCELLIFRNESIK